MQQNDARLLESCCPPLGVCHVLRLVRKKSRNMTLTVIFLIIIQSQHMRNTATRANTRLLLLEHLPTNRNGWTQSWQRLARFPSYPRELDEESHNAKHLGPQAQRQAFWCGFLQKIGWREKRQKRDFCRKRRQVHSRLLLFFPYIFWGIVLGCFEVPLLETLVVDPGFTSLGPDSSARVWKPGMWWWDWGYAWFIWPISYHITS